MDNVQCLGTEANLGECPSRGIRRHDCQHKEDAGARCTDHNNTSTSESGSSTDSRNGSYTVSSTDSSIVSITASRTDPDNGASGLVTESTGTGSTDNTPEDIDIVTSDGVIGHDATTSIVAGDVGSSDSTTNSNTVTESAGTTIEDSGVSSSGLYYISCH